MNLKTRLSNSLQRLPEEQLRTRIMYALGENCIQDLEEKASRRPDLDLKLYMAMELATRAPSVANALLKTLNLRNR